MKTQKKTSKKKTNKPAFAMQLDKIMKRRKMTNKELATLLHVAETTVSGYRSGRRAPDPERIKQICILIPVSANYLLGISDNPNF